MNPAAPPDPFGDAGRVLCTIGSGMTEQNDAARVVTVLQNCAKQLRWAHRNLSRSAVPVDPDPLAKIDGVAVALEGLAGDVESVLNQAVRTVGGLRTQADRLRRTNDALSSRGIERL